MAEGDAHRVVSWCRDDGVSGSNGIEIRLGLVDALEVLQSGQAKGLVVYRLDRPSRDLVVQEQLLAESGGSAAVPSRPPPRSPGTSSTIPMTRRGS